MSEIALPHTARIGQATAIEQSRAVAEVQAAIVVAQQCPRNIQAAQRSMKDSCRMPALAERAFYRFPRSGKTVSGASVHLARELARCWGNIQYGIAELSRDDVAGQSEMLAYAWDVQTNARASTAFIVPHARDTQGGPKRLADLREVYENNSNNGARRVRECIFAVLPPWFVEEAKELCAQTVKDGGGKPLTQRVAQIIATFDALGVSEDDIARKLGKPSDKWSEYDVGQLRIAYRSIQSGEVSREQEFPTPTVTAEEVAAPAQIPSGPVEPTPEDIADMNAEAAR